MASRLVATLVFTRSCTNGEKLTILIFIDIGPRGRHISHIDIVRVFIRLLLNLFFFWLLQRLQIPSRTNRSVSDLIINHIAIFFIAEANVVQILLLILHSSVYLISCFHLFLLVDRVASVVFLLINLVLVALLFLLLIESFKGSLTLLCEHVDKIYVRFFAQVLGLLFFARQLWCNFLHKPDKLERFTVYDAIFTLFGVGRFDTVNVATLMFFDYPATFLLCLLSVVARVPVFDVLAQVQRRKLRVPKLAPHVLHDFPFRFS